jgi:streptogramin lyase
MKHLLTLLAVASIALVAAAATPSAAAPPGVVAIRTPGFPAHVSAGFRSIWVISHRGGYLYRIDPRTNRVAATIDVTDALCFVPTVAGGALWVSNCGGLAAFETVYKVDPATNRVVDRVPGNSPAFGAGSLWTFVSKENRIYRIDPRSGLVLKTIRIAQLGADATGDFTVGGTAFGSTWIGTCSKVARISPATNVVQSIIRLPRSAACGTLRRGYLAGARMGFVDDRAWYVTENGLYSIDARSNRARRMPIRVLPHAEWGDDVVIGRYGSVWVRTSDTRVSRIDPRSGRVVATYPATGGGGGFTLAFGSLWVTNAISDTVWRERLRKP